MTQPPQSTGAREPRNSARRCTPLSALSWLDLLHQIMQALRRRRDHGQRDIRIFPDAGYDMVGGHPHDACIGDCLGGAGYCPPVKAADSAKLSPVVKR